MKKSFLQVDNILITIAILIAILALPINPFHDNLFTAPASDSGEVFDGDEGSFVLGGAGGGVPQDPCLTNQICSGPCVFGNIQKGQCMRSTTNGPCTCSSSSIIVDPAPLPPPCIPSDPVCSPYRCTTPSGQLGYCAIDNVEGRGCICDTGLISPGPPGKVPGVGIDCNFQTNLISNKRLTFMKSDMYNYFDPQLLIDSQNNVYIIFRATEFASPNWHNIHFMKLDNSGNILIPPRKIYNAKVHSLSATIDKNNNVHIAFQEYPSAGYHVGYISLDSNGNMRFPNPIELSSPHNRPWRVSGEVKLVSDKQSNTHVLWHIGYDIQATKEHIYYTKIASDGRILISEKILNSFNYRSPSCLSFYYDKILLDLEIDQNNNLNLVVGFKEYYGPSCTLSSNIFYQQFDNSGNPVSSLSRLNNAEGLTRDPKISLERDGAHIIWSVRGSNPSIPGVGIYYTKLNSNGQTVIDDSYVSSYQSTDYGGSSDISYNPKFKRIHIASPSIIQNILYPYSDIILSTLNEIVQRTQPDSKIPNSPPIVALTNIEPVLAIDSNGKLHALWIDGRHGNYQNPLRQDQELYYSQWECN